MCDTNPDRYHPNQALGNPFSVAGQQLTPSSPHSRPRLRKLRKHQVVQRWSNGGHILTITNTNSTTTNCSSSSNRVLCVPEALVARLVGGRVRARVGVVDEDRMASGAMSRAKECIPKRR